MSELLRELGLVATAVRECGDREVLALWDGVEYGPGFDRLVGLAEDAGAGVHVALDLYVEVDTPGAISRYGGATELGRRVNGGSRW